MTLAEALDTIEELRERIRQLEADAAPPTKLPASWGITPIQSHILRCILSADGGIVSIAQIQTRVYGMRMEPVSDSVIYMHVSSIRKKLPWLQVNMAHGRGYYINSKDIHEFYALARRTIDEQTFLNND